MIDTTDTTLRKSIAINAKPSKIWHILTDDVCIRQRCTPFSVGTHAITDRQEGSDITRIVGTDVCTKGRLTTFDLHKKIVSTFYEGNAKDGFTDVLKDSVESYEIVPAGDGVILNIISGPSSEAERAEYGEMMNTMRDQALVIIKKLSETTKLRVSTTISAPLGTVRDAMNNPTHIVNRCFASGDWCCPRSTNDLTVGGILCTRMEAKDGSFGFDMTGQYTLVEPMSKLSYIMGSYTKDTNFVPAGRVVDVTFTESVDGVLITETFDAEEIHPLEMQQAGWQAILENFKKYVESL